MKLMGRGGGHQYCGVSCDNDAFILSMDNFKRLEWVHFDEPKTVTGPDGRPQTITKELHVGTGHRLKEFAEFMNTDPETNRPARGTGRQKYKKSMGATIPHGECPKVGIGGHSQSGGYGHTARAFGCAVDYIYGFTIVLADGEVRTVNKDSNDPRTGTCIGRSSAGARAPSASPPTWSYTPSTTRTTLTPRRFRCLTRTVPSE